MSEWVTVFFCQQIDCLEETGTQEDDKAISDSIPDLKSKKKGKKGQTITQCIFFWKCKLNHVFILKKKVSNFLV